jgi:hypothetical protein
MQLETSEPLGSDFEPSGPPHWLWRLLRTLLIALGVLVGAFICLLFANPRGMRSRAQGQLTACKSNCKNVATALEMYASDNKGRYPVVLSSLTRGNYLKLIPTCPAAGSDTYTASYQVQANPDRFSFYCQGNNHPKAYAGFSPPYDNFPQYSAEMGLLDHP